MLHCCPNILWPAKLPFCGAPVQLNMLSPSLFLSPSGCGSLGWGVSHASGSSSPLGSILNVHQVESQVFHMLYFMTSIHLFLYVPLLRCFRTSVSSGGFRLGPGEGGHRAPAPPPSFVTTHDFLAKITQNPISLLPNFRKVGNLQLPLNAQRPKRLQLQGGFAPWPLTRGSAPGSRWELRPQTLL